jgi:hypothetical protein
MKPGIGLCADAFKKKFHCKANASVKAIFERRLARHH